jgi:hypothetical protein
LQHWIKQMTLFRIAFDLSGCNAPGCEAVVYMPFLDENAAWDWARSNWRAFGGSASRVKSVMENITVESK